ncbi:MAG: PRC-barrel domain-containing protein [Pedobacter sp.]
MENNEINRTTYLQELSESDFEIADHQPDINGWEIIDSLGNEIGEVKDLIFDSSARKVRYIVADLDFEAEDGKSFFRKIVLLPIGVVVLDNDDEEVVIENFALSQLLSLPEYESGKIISPVEELAVRHAFLGNAALPNASAVVYDNHPEDFYIHGHFEDAHFTRHQNDRGTTTN